MYLWRREKTALDLLKLAAVGVPTRRLTKVGDRSVLLLRRFDRDGEDPDVRVPYISAMTATSSNDGDSADYVEVAEAVRELSPSPRNDLHELFTRTVASVVLGNTDDHLRNLGFLAARAAWSLSPAFDVNPTPELGRRRSTSIAGADTFPNEVEGLLALAEDCSLSQQQAKHVMAHVADSVSEWRTISGRSGIAEREIRMMSESIDPRLELITKLSRS
ncbi:HipA domain-containing protein [Actinomycetaceae bacterium MB13-C1-2]|nr:HipA domain-containing protein [Actinomycetaceae bacterium MB13-C1-2]